MPQRAPRRAFSGWLVLTLAVVLACGAWPARAQTAAEKPTLVIELGSHSAPVRRIDVHPGRGVAVTASDDRTARVWDLASGEWRHVLRPLATGNEVGRLYGAAIHPTQPLVAVAGNSGSADTAHLIYLFDLDSGALRRTIDAKAGDVRKLVWSADGTVLLAGYSGTTSSNHGLRAFSLDGRELLDDRHPGPVFGIAVGPGGQTAAVGLDGTLRSYRVGNGAAAVTGNIAISGRRPAGVAFSPDGTRLASDTSLLGTTSSDPQPRLFIRFGGAGLASATSTTAAESLVFTRAGAPFTPTATACPAGSLSNTFCFIDTTQSTSLVTVLNYNGVSEPESFSCVPEQRAKRRPI